MIKKFICGMAGPTVVEEFTERKVYLGDVLESSGFVRVIMDDGDFGYLEFVEEIGLWAYCTGGEVGKPHRIHASFKEVES